MESVHCHLYMLNVLNYALFGLVCHSHAMSNQFDRYGSFWKIWVMSQCSKFIVIISRCETSSKQERSLNASS